MVMSNKAKFTKTEGCPLREVPASRSSFVTSKTHPMKLLLMGLSLASIVPVEPAILTAVHMLQTSMEHTSITRDPLLKEDSWTVLEASFQKRRGHR